jgi:hypothetical protein
MGGPFTVYRRASHWASAQVSPGIGGDFTTYRFSFRSRKFGRRSVQSSLAIGGYFAGCRRRFPPVTVGLGDGETIAWLFLYPHFSTAAVS